MERLAVRFYETRQPNFTVDDFAAHVTEAYENAKESVVACTTPSYFDEWRESGVAQRLALTNESFVREKKGRVIRFYFVNGEFKQRYPDLANILRDHLTRGVEAFVVHVDRYEHTVMKEVFGTGQVNLDIFEQAFVDARIYLRTRFDANAVKIEVDQRRAQCLNQYKTSLRRFLSEWQGGLYRPKIDPMSPFEIQWGVPLAPRDLSALREDVDGLFGVELP